jgi:DNA integrity scanning protein DisA with diadenylate cyclase activity
MDKLLSFLVTIRWQDAVDIAINSYILFRLYVLFRGTNVFRVLMGIAFLWFFQRMAVSLGLIVTSWVIQGIIAAAALIIIVVFRNEIRSVLQAKNLRAILWGSLREGLTTPVEEIVEAVFELGRRRMLEEVIQSGISWQGSLSREMILSIFWHDNPVHDGAAIIQGDQVAEVSSVLPLSQRTDLPSHYGTRHRAAAGLAEETDALVLIVSEERGTVSVAKGSELKGVRGKEALAHILYEHVGIPETEEGRVGKGKLELGIAALVSFLFISGVWFSFTRGMDALSTLEIPIEYMNRAPKMQILDASVNAVRLDLSGSGALIRSVRPEQVKVRLDLSKAVVGLNAFNISQENITLPPGVILKNVRPQFVEVTLDVLVKQEFPIQVDWVGKLPGNLRLVEAMIAPERIQVIGESRLLDNVSTVYTEKVSVDRIDKSGTVTVKVALSPASLKFATESESRVTVDYVVEEREK